MNDVVMLEAALFQLRTGAEEIDATYAPQLELSLSVLANAIASAREGGLNAACVSDIDFALNDLGAAIDELPAGDADRLASPLQLIREDVERLKQATSLDPALVDGIRALLTKLRARRAAIERQTYREGDASPLPHPPEELRAEALPLRDALAVAGYATPALDALIEEPESLRFHSITAIVDELEVIGG